MPTHQRPYFLLLALHLGLATAAYAGESDKSVLPEAPALAQPALEAVGVPLVSTHPQPASGKPSLLLASNELTPAQIRALEDAPPPAPPALGLRSSPAVAPPLFRPAPLPPPGNYVAQRGRRGTGLLAGGIIVTGIGIPFIMGGIVQFAPSPHSYQSSGCHSDCAALNAIGGSMLIGFGAVLAVVGIPMLAVGGYRYSSSVD